MSRAWAAAFVMTLLQACAPIYGANFGYPATPPTPRFAEAVAHANGSDDDDPMRGRELVIDIGTHTAADLATFYRRHFSASEGWIDGSQEVGERRRGEPPDGFVLCLVNNTESGFDQYVEVSRYRGKSASIGHNRFLVSASRLSVDSRSGPRTTDRCGLASGWFPAEFSRSASNRPHSWRRMPEARSWTAPVYTLRK